MTAKRLKADEQARAQADREAQGLAEATEPQLYDDGRTIDELSDTEVLDLAGVHGPGVIGKELFDRAKEIRSRTDGGKLGPALSNPDYGDKTVAAWEGVDRKAVAKLADKAEISYKPKTSRTDLIKMLAARGVTAPPDGEDED